MMDRYYFELRAIRPHRSSKGPSGMVRCIGSLLFLREGNGGDRSGRLVLDALGLSGLYEELGNSAHSTAFQRHKLPAEVDTIYKGLSWKRKTAWRILIAWGGNLRPGPLF